MANLTYIGGYDAVAVEMPNYGEQVVERGGTLSTTDEHAAALLLQPANWQAEAVAAPSKPVVKPTEPTTTKDSE